MAMKNCGQRWISIETLDSTLVETNRVRFASRLQALRTISISHINSLTRKSEVHIAAWHRLCYHTQSIIYDSSHHRTQTIKRTKQQYDRVSYQPNSFTYTLLLHINYVGHVARFLGIFPTCTNARLQHRSIEWYVLCTGLLRWWCEYVCM